MFWLERKQRQESERAVDRNVGRQGAKGRGSRAAAERQREKDVELIIMKLLKRQH